MMQKLRKQITVFLWFAVGIFVAFIFFQWGMRFAGSRALTKRQKGIIGEVNGKPISSTSYNNLVAGYMEMGLTEDEAGDSAFYTLVEATILRDFYQTAKLIPSDKEIIEVIKTNPPSEILQDTLFYTNGNFDYLRYAEILQNPQNIGYFRQYEALIRDALPRQRLSTYLLSTVQPTAVINEYLKENTVFTAECGEVYIENIPVKFTEEELQEYYEKAKDYFKRPPSHLVKFVKFDLSPSLEDERLLIEEAKDILSQIQSGVSFDTLAYRFSDDAKTKKEFGYLGFVKRGDIGKELEDIVFSMSKGEVRGPIKTDEGIYILKCKSKTGAQHSPKNSVEILQIFLRLTPSYETRSMIIEKAVSFIELTKENGFEKAAEGMNLGVKTTRSSRIDGMDISNFIAGAKKGKISQPVPRRDGIYVLMYEGKLPEVLPAYSDIKEEVKERFLDERRKKMAQERLLEVKTDVESGKNFARALKSFGITYRIAKNFVITDPGDNLPTEPAFYGALWAMRDDDLSEPVIGRKYCYLIKCIKRKEPRKEQIQKGFADFQLNLWREERDKIFDEWLKSQIASAKIEDYRY
ncbi:MAG: peptidyl-prolyl cis-trans isomerase [candidate division WOR-3 bacterium]|nr:peptidyl-prolyl cis-trans isomerase [candidate division WOR-3 bacterium]